MLQPKKTKHRKQFRLRSQSKGISTRGATIAFGKIAIKAVQVEATRRVISRASKRGGKTWIRIFPQKVLTSKGAEVPMGSGKGAPDKWVCQVKPGRILFEMAGADMATMKEALRLAIYKLPIKCKIITTEI